ncbi:MAG: hypothetical protein K0S54_1675 [Alphaproteobacteria bacterium]|nr:hypothetical protein [Alphaproteobacteria bacterium]
MAIETLFSLSSTLAVSGWIALLASRFFPVLAERISGLAIPLLLSVAYAGLVLAFWRGAEGGFDTLDNVMRLFTSKEIALAGWIHYLAFDLFVGAWIVRTARSESIAFLPIVPCLLLTFLFGPVGFLAFSALRLARAAMPRPATV